MGRSGIRKNFRANLDGTSIEDLLIPDLIAPLRITVDTIGNRIYWTDNGANKIQCSEYDGTNVNNIIEVGLISPKGIALDEHEGKLYWGDFGTHRIQRCDLDGSNIETVIENVGKPSGVVIYKDQVDTSCRVVYHTDTSSLFSLPSRIQCTSSGDTIYFGSCLWGDTIQGPIVIDKDVTIVSNPKNGILLTGVDDQPAFIILPGVQVNIVGMQLSPSSQIPHLLVENNGVLTLVNCQIYKNGVSEIGVLIENSGNGTTEIIGDSNIGN